MTVILIIGVFGSTGTNQVIIVYYLMVTTTLHAVECFSYYAMGIKGGYLNFILLLTGQRSIPWPSSPVRILGCCWSALSTTLDLKDSFCII